MSDIENTSQFLEALNQWYTTPFGLRLKADVASTLLQVLRMFTVHELLHLGVSGFEESLAGQRRERMLFYADLTCEQLLSSNENTLPLKADSQPCVVLLHGLDVAQSPHSVLRELERIIAMDGYLVIVGFNTHSLWGGYRPLSNLMNLIHWRQDIPWHLNFHSPGRLRDWLELLGFEVLSTRTVNYQPLWQHDKIIRRSRFLNAIGNIALPALGNVYVSVARKRTVPITPIKFKWKLRSKLLRPNVIEPTANTAIK